MTPEPDETELSRAEIEAMWEQGEPVGLVGVPFVLYNSVFVQRVTTVTSTEGFRASVDSGWLHRDHWTAPESLGFEEKSETAAAQV